VATAPALATDHPAGTGTAGTSALCGCRLLQPASTKANANAGKAMAPLPGRLPSETGDWKRKDFMDVFENHSQ
jgi:hypothetical protein